MEQSSLEDLNYFCPGVIYGGAEHLSEYAPAGSANLRAGRIVMREDGLPIPLFGVQLRDGASVAVLNPQPHANLPAEVAQDESGRTFVDERILLGVVGASTNADGKIEFGYWFPGSEPQILGSPDSGRRVFPRYYHPLRDGFQQEYRVDFRFGRGETFHDFYRNAWRWGWETLQPAVNYHDIELVRRVLADMLADRVMTRDGRTGFPFFMDAVTGRLGSDARDTDAIMGFIGKNLESAAALLAEGTRDSSPRGTRFRQLAVEVIDTFVRTLKLSPPAGEGFNLVTGEPSMTYPKGDLVPCCDDRIYLRCFTDDLVWVLHAFQQERRAGREHPEWLRWASGFGDWLLTQQRPDGSFPRSWHAGTGEVYDPSDNSTFAGIAFLVRLSGVTGNKRYLEAAGRAGEFSWSRYHSRDQYAGGTINNPNVTDKEAGTLAMGGFLALYDATREAKWLARARSAADYAETWIYCWNVPMPEGEDDSRLHWKRGVPTTGVGRIVTTAAYVDQWMAADPAKFAELYLLTRDEHYLDVARLLLHNTKNMLALPGRQFDLAGPGWQQEHWRLGALRGFGHDRSWLPWVTTNHLTGIIALEELAPELLRKLSGGDEPRQPASDSGETK